MSLDTNMDGLIKQLHKVVDKDIICVEQHALAQANKGTFTEHFTHQVIISPNTREELKLILAEINRYNASNQDDSISLYPISSGNNWGYTTKEPCTNNSILLNLNKFIAISDYDAEQGAITLEPGVSQEMLYQYLVAQGGDFWMDATGSSPASSIIGNTLERGFGHTAYGDHFDKVCGLEVMLADGSIIHTGLHQFNQMAFPAKAAQHYKWGVGPYVDGIFTQSNFGIVLSMTIWLMPKPEHYEAFFISLKKDDQLSEFVTALQPLKLRGVLKSALHIGNLDKAIQALTFYPYDKTHGKTPLPSDIKQLLKSKYMLNAWTASGAFYGTKAEVKVWKNQLKQAVSHLNPIINFIDQDKLTWLTKLKGLLTKLTGKALDENIAMLEKVFHLKRGVPSYHFLTSTLYAKRKLPADVRINDLTQHNVGLLWLAPIAPINGQAVEEIKSLTYEVLKEFGFDPGLSITLLTERSLECVISIAFDRDEEGADKNAIACHNKLLGLMLDKGYYPYRLSSPIQHNYHKLFTSSLNPTLKRLKTALDPNNVIAKDKYGI